jgi:hypothetical protein
VDTGDPTAADDPGAPGRTGGAAGWTAAPGLGAEVEGVVAWSRKTSAAAGIDELTGK